MGRPRRGVDILARLHFTEETGSTNADLLASSEARHGDWLIARRQTAGRGRQGRSWQSLEGNFFGSVLMILQESDPPAASLSLLAGLAVVETLAATPPHFGAFLKWPNDVMLSDGKVAGILLERKGERVVAGFGVNLETAPEIDGRKTTNLEGAVSPEQFGADLAGTFGNLFRIWRATPSCEWLIRAWEGAATPRGTSLQVHDGSGRRLAGQFDGLEPDGALRLRTAQGVEIVRAGDVEL